ncbi:hypothetical protein, partial [Succinivibrio dextrinosolvens]|uniref:hypothetical protein n=1 Tax=Succinivibrio dextrinosolvens TaxID=83771 RepID=UPI001C4303DE
HKPDEVKKHQPNKCMICPHFASCAANGKVFERSLRGLVNISKNSKRAVLNPLASAMGSRSIL